MKIIEMPRLKELVLLEHGEAWLLLCAVSLVVAGVNLATAPVPAVQVLTTLPLAGLASKLHKIHQRDHDTPRRPGRTPKPRPLWVSYDQLAAVLHHREALSCCAVGSPAEKLLLLGILGKFQQKSLNLSQFIIFS